MRIKYDKGTLQIDLHDLLRYVSNETKAEFIESLSCDDDIIKHVTNQILDGWTENICSGGKSCIASEDPNQGLDWAVRQVALRSGEVAKKEIERLQEALKISNDAVQRALSELSGLRRAQWTGNEYR